MTRLNPGAAPRPFLLRGLGRALLGVGAAVAALVALRPVQDRVTAPYMDDARAQPGPQPLPRSRDLPDPPLRRRADPYRLGHASDDRQPSTEHGERGPASKRIIVGYGFWVFLLSDIIMFAAFFAAYAVLHGRTAGGPSGQDLFDITSAALETGCLLTSTLACGLAMVGLHARDARWFYFGMAATFVLGAAFLALELREFWSMIAAGNGPARSAFLSSFFALVGLHGAHVSAGLLWLLTMVAQVWVKGPRADILRRVLCFSLFWHALDIVWIGLFTVVYLMGVQA